MLAYLLLKSSTCDTKHTDDFRCGTKVHLQNKSSVVVPCRTRGTTGLFRFSFPYAEIIWYFGGFGGVTFQFFSLVSYSWLHLPLPSCRHDRGLRTHVLRFLMYGNIAWDQLGADNKRCWLHHGERLLPLLRWNPPTPPPSVRPVGTIAGRPLGAAAAYGLQVWQHQAERGTKSRNKQRKS